MCGIAGILSVCSEINNKSLESFSKSLAHRGPDDNGIWTDSTLTVGMIHTRLAIIDLTKSGHQPMQTPDGRYTIVFNGEIYNYKKLKLNLEKQGKSFLSSSDTEVLLQLFAKDGLSMLTEIRGMFAFAIWDSFEEKLTLARDPLGIKPLYFSQYDTGIAFASELKALKNAGFGGKLDAKATGAFLQLGSIPAPLSLWKDIESLTPGEYLQWEKKSGKVIRDNYWSYTEQFDNKRLELITDYDEALDLVRQTLLDSVKAHLVSDVPVGAFLSGGIDSTAVVSLMRQAGQDKISTFSIVFDDKELDESYYSRLAAKFYNTDHHEWQVTRKEFLDLKNEFIEGVDSPSIDGLNTWLVARFARRNGFKVVTSGVGGDEFFYGYEGSFKQLPSILRKMRFLPGPIRKLISKALFLNQTGSRINKLREILDSCHSLEKGYLAYRGLFSQTEANKLIDDKNFAKEALTLDLKSLLPGLPSGEYTEPKISVLEVARYLSSQLLPDSDKFSMAHALELRLPLVDRVVAENLTKIHPKLFYDNKNTPKALLVNSVGDIPDEIVFRKKQGFNLPVDKWIKSDKLSVQSDFWNKESCKKIRDAFNAGKAHWAKPWGIEVLNSLIKDRL